MSSGADGGHRPGKDPAALEGAVVVLGVTAGIAAYKAVEVCRQLVDRGAHVIPVLTPAATRFVGTATFSALASEPARTELFDPHDPIPHTHLGQAADLVLVAPATANFLAETAAGLAHDLLGAVLLATTAPVVVCPAMHAEMWKHPSVVDNLTTLARRGVVVVAPESGHLAGGDEGPGRLADPSLIVAAAAAVLASGRGSRACGCSSPPGGRANRSIPSATSATGRRDDRGTRSPPKPVGGAPRSPSCRLRRSNPPQAWNSCRSRPRPSFPGRSSPAPGRRTSS